MSRSKKRNNRKKQNNQTKKKTTKNVILASNAPKQAKLGQPAPEPAEKEVITVPVTELMSKPEGTGSAYISPESSSVRSAVHLTVETGGIVVRDHGIDLGQC